MQTYYSKIDQYQKMKLYFESKTKQDKNSCLGVGPTPKQLFFFCFVLFFFQNIWFKQVTKASTLGNKLRRSLEEKWTDGLVL